MAIMAHPPNNNPLPEKLNRISALILHLYREGRDPDLRSLARLSRSQLSEEPSSDRKGLLAQLLLLFHPDRLNHQLNSHEKSGDYSLLIEKVWQWKEKLNSPEGKYRNTVSRERPTTETPKEENIWSDFYQEHEFWSDPSFTDAEYDTDTLSEQSLYEDEEELPPDSINQHDFLDAVHRQMYGNLNIPIDPSHLSMLEGELDLSSMEIEYLWGAEKCIYVTSLNLSDNEISDLRPLSSLTSLTELYLSSNEITDIEPLKHLNSLEILDLTDNRISDLTPLLSLASLRILMASIPRTPKTKAKQIPDGLFNKQIEQLKQNGVIVIENA